MKFVVKSLVLVICLFVIVPMYSQNRKLEVQGTVMDDDGLPAISIVIRDKTAEGEVYGITDYDGHFKIMADPTTSLHFSGLTYAPKVVKLNGKQRINVVLAFESRQLNEVVVTAKRIVNKLMPEPTDIEIVGNQYIIHPKVKVPRKIFTADSRVIVQPMLVNVTKGTQRLFQPAVVTGKKYAITLERMMEFDMSRDPLHPYYQKSKRVGRDELIAYHDSLHVEDPDDEYRCDIFMYMVDYRKATYKDTVVIAKGTVNPMRFFDFKIGAKHILDDKYIPRPKKQLRGDQGQVNLTFLVNSAKIDNSDPNNLLELDKMHSKLSNIDNDPNAEFTSFRVEGISSPEGSYKRNLTLARQRTETAKETILTFLNPGTVVAMRDSIRTDARVEPWERVAELMEQDSLSAAGLRKIIEKYPDNLDAQSRQVPKLPEYRSVIKETYLKKLRRVEYFFNYSVLRLLNDNEIREIYEEDYKKLMPYEFWRLYVNAKTPDERMKICKQALELYPDFMQAANEMAVMLIEKDQPDAKLLEPFINDTAPAELICNHIVALLHEREYTKADSLALLLPETPLTEEIRMVSGALNGSYESAYEYFKPKGGVNEVLLLLALKRNEEAFEKAEELPEDALGFYLRATAANRLDKLTEAFAYLKRAITEDPKYKEIARIDGDVAELMQQIEDENKEQSKNENNEEKK